MPPQSDLPLINKAANPVAAPPAGATLDDWLHFLESLHPAEIELGLDRVLIVFRRLFRHNPDARIIIVGGTNGKGSTVAALERLLILAGRSTGAYTSPHLQRYNERVRVNGQEVTDDHLVQAFEAVEAARHGTSLTYFEFGTLAAFEIFRAAGVDDWVLEVGLGGRLDAVNVVDADLAIITSVDLDHQAFLGNDTETIGFEKAGILRAGRPAIFADERPPRSVLQQASAQGVRLLRPGDGYRLRPAGQQDAYRLLEVDGDSVSVKIPCQGLPVNSLAAAVVAIRSLEPELPVSSITRALEGLSLPGRFEILRESPMVIADVGHNPHAARWLASRMAALRTPGQRLLAVYGALADKDVDGVVAAMAGQVDLWFPTALDVPRGLTCELLIKPMAGLKRVDCAANVKEALSAALAQAAETDMILVFGSFHTVVAARKQLI